MTTIVASAPSAAQRRHIIILFSDLSHSTAIAAQMEPEDYDDLLQQLRDIIEIIVPRHGGDIIRIDGDGVICLFGHPISHEDAGRRATEAAIDLHNAASQLNEAFGTAERPIQLHTGIHSGIVLLKKGDLVRGKYEILGDATNIAARICDAAMADQILVSQTTLEPDLPFFQTGQRKTLAIKGRRAGVDVLEILGREAIETRFAARTSGYATPFFGRQSELAVLEQCLKRCQEGNAELVIIAGSAGIGKSRLALEFLSRCEAQGTQVHRSYCEAYLGTRPLQPFIQLAKSLWLIDEAHYPKTHRDTIARLLVKEPDTTDLKLPSLDALTSAFLALFAAQLAINARPIILHIDDWQWADDASQQLLERLIEHTNLHIIYMLNMRISDALRSEQIRSTIINLLPLTPDEAARAIEVLLPAPDPFLVERIAFQSGGSPLFIEELCHAFPFGDDHRGFIDKTSWLDMLIQARFERLPVELATLVRTASVIGFFIPMWLFESMTGIASDHPVMHELAAADFIFQGEIEGTLRFKHGITRDAVYRTVGLNERKLLHRQAVEALIVRSKNVGEEELLEALAYHYGACQNNEKALHYSILAGDRAMAGSILDRAQTHYRAALEIIATAEQSPEFSKRANEVANKFGLACVVDPSRDQLPILNDVLVRARSRDDAEGAAWAQYWIGFILYGLGEPRQSIPYLEDAVRSAQSVGNEKLTGTINATLGQAYATACDYKLALPLLNDAIAIKYIFRKEGRPSIVLSYSLACRALVYADQGHFEKAYHDLDEAISVLGGIEVEMTASVLTLRCAVCLWHGRFKEAYDLAIYSREIAARARARYIFVNCGSLSGYAKWCIDADANILDQIIEATEWLEKTARQQFSSLNYGWLSEALVSLGRFDEARRYAARAFARARKGDRLGEAMAARAMATAAMNAHGRRSPSFYLAIAKASAEARGSSHEREKNMVCEAAYFP